MLYFKNNGLIPIEGITTMGVNVKEGDGAIGHFGTGLKITIAGILRLGGSITVYRGEYAHSFTLKRINVRGKDFDLVHMNGEPLGFTTELGKNWKPWMFYRELESNCRDEGGETHLVDDDMGVPLSKDSTVIAVICEDVEEVYPNRHLYFLDDRSVYKVPGLVSFHRGNNDMFYYKGIAVGALDGVSFPYNVNILADRRHDLTEDRTLSITEYRRMLRQSIPQIDDLAFLKTIFPEANHEIKPLVLELDFSYGFNVTPSDVFLDYMLYLHANFPMAINTSITELLVEHGRIDRHSVRKAEAFTPQESAMVDRALQYLVDLGYNEDDVKAYPVYKAHLGNGILGMADTFTKKIYLTPRVLDMGVKQVCTCLHEEFLHLKYSYNDCSRDLQSYLFDKVATMHEKQHGVIVA